MARPGQQPHDIRNRQPGDLAGKLLPSADKGHRLNHHADHVRLGEEVLEDRGKLVFVDATGRRDRQRSGHVGLGQAIENRSFRAASLLPRSIW